MNSEITNNDDEFNIEDIDASLLIFSKKLQDEQVLKIKPQIEPQLESQLEPQIENKKETYIPQYEVLNVSKSSDCILVTVKEIKSGRTAIGSGFSQTVAKSKAIKKLKKIA